MATRIFGRENIDNSVSGNNTNGHYLSLIFTGIFFNDDNSTINKTIVVIIENVLKSSYMKNN